MGVKRFLYSLAVISLFYITVASITGCAQIGMPTGGPRDTLAPVLLNTIPPQRQTNFTGNKIVLNFNEYIDVQDIQTNVLVSPYPKINPDINFKLKTVTVKIRDTLLPNTTYSINFGNAIRDNNEGNPYKNFTYVFSTGNTIDSLKLSGKVLLAESGKTDSTLLALLYRNAPDSAVQTRKPDYIAKVNPDGGFTFINLPPGIFKVYVLKDGDGGKTYNSKIEFFAFNNTDVIISDSTPPVLLYAYAEEKDIPKIPSPTDNNKKNVEKKFRYSVSVSSSKQSLLDPLTITFSRPLKSFDAGSIILTDSNFRKINGTVLLLDSTKTILSLNTTKWAEDFDYHLIIDSSAVTDTFGTHLAKTDTIRFKSKSAEEYGNVLLRFAHYDPSRHIVLQFFRGDDLFMAVPVTAATWNDRLFEPGEYELRILYDENNNGKWDPGSYKEKRQPEKANTLEKKLMVKANWDNEKDIEL